MACKICETRRPRRFCPGVGGDICPVCCGTEREMSVNCPFDCEYLRDAREHERLPPIETDSVPNQDIKITDHFLRENETLAAYAGRILFDAAMSTPGAVDFDVREALESLIRTYRTLESGLYYETRPNNPLAARIQAGLQDGVARLREHLAKQYGVNTIRDADVLGVLVFLQRVEIQHNNGRRRGRAFLDFLRTQVQTVPSPGGAGEQPPAAGPSLILP